MYQPTRAGGYRLVAVEYVTFQAGQTVLGQPMNTVPVGNRYGVPAEFYAKHAWIWQGNPERHLRRLEPEHHVPRRGRQRRLTSRSRAASTAGPARARPFRSCRPRSQLGRRGCGDATGRPAARLGPRPMDDPGGDLGAPAGAQLREDVLDVGARPSSGETHSSRGDLGVRQALGDLPGDLELADGQRPPRLVLERRGRGRPAPARRRERASGSLRSVAGDRAHLGQRPPPRRRAGSSAGGSAARSRRAQVASHDSAALLPAARPPARAPRAPQTASRPQGGAGRRRGSAPARAAVSQPARWSRSAGDPPLGIVRAVARAS